MSQISLPRGVFTISLDFELIWGTVDLFGPEGFARACEVEREQVIDRLLALFSEFEMPATWCTLGHLFLDKCECTDGKKHPEIVPPQHAWQSDWFEHDPCGDEKSQPNFYGRSLVEKVRACKVEQEIGSHSFSHVIFGDARCSRETAETELCECVRLAEAMGIELKSFAFPRNWSGHLDVLAEQGFSCYRGPEPVWYEQGERTKIKRVAHLWDVLIAAQPPVVLPELTPQGLWNVPGSMILFPMNGPRKYLPRSLRVRRAIRGLNAAAREKKIFHLWFHPTNMADEIDAMFGTLRLILKHASAMRDRGELDFLPMKALAQRQN